MPLDQTTREMCSRQLTGRHFLDLRDLPATALREILDLAHEMKRAGKRVPDHLRPAGIADDVLVMIFEKPSTRTRISFDIAMRQLGGQTLALNSSDLQLGRGESVSDTAKVLSRYADIIMLRAMRHETLLELAAHADIPVINGLTDRSHPCQIMADLMTLEEHRGPVANQTVAWVGDGNNVAASYIHASAKLGFRFKIATPLQLRPDTDLLSWARTAGANVEVVDDAAEAVEKADCVVTDTWISMGQTGERERKQLLAPYAVDADLMAKAASDAIFMHCLPAYRGNEVSADVIDGPQSVVFDEAENRLHVQKAILAWCLSKPANG